MTRASRWIVSLWVVGCTSNPPPSPPPEALAPPALSGAPVSAAVAASSGPTPEDSLPEDPDAGARRPPDCSGAPEGEVVLPPGPSSSGVGMLSNASPDASVDRSYPELGPALVKVLPGLRCCYGEARRTRPDLAGQVVVELWLTPDGKAKSVSQARRKSDINDPMLGSCVENILSEVSYPASRRAQPTLVRLPLVFRPGVR